MPLNKSYKQDRVNEDVKRILSQILRDIKDPRIPPMPSVMHAEVSPDLKYAKIFISFYGEYDEAEVRRGLKAAKGFIRKRLGEQLGMRYVPELTFEIDHSAGNAARIEELIKKTHFGDE